MKYFSLIWSNLFRKKIRALFTLLSLLCAFLLFGLLQAVNVLFVSAPQAAGVTRLITQSRVSFTESLPLRMLSEIERVPGIAAVNYTQWFGGIYQDPKNFFPQFATSPERLQNTYPEWIMPEEQWQAFRSTRTGAIVGRRLATRFGWEIGDKVPIQSTIWPQQNGDKTWTFDIVGIYNGYNDDWKKRTNLMYINFDYFDEARQFANGSAGTFALKLQDPNQANQIAQRVDKLFENSPDETKTQTEQDFQLGFFKQIGDIGLIVNLILVAVFFTILLLTGNTMAQAVRERIPEFAVLKTLGFADRKILFLVLSESLLMCAFGGLLGLQLASIILAFLNANYPEFPPFRADFTVWWQGLLTMACLALVVGLPPAIRAGRLKIVDALAGR